MATATINIYESPTFGIAPTDKQWPKIVTAIKAKGWTMTAIDKLNNNFSANWDRGSTTARRVLFENSRPYADWVKKNKRNPTMKELADLVTKYFKDWNGKMYTTVIIGTATVHRNELGANLKLDDKLVASGKNGHYTVFYRKFVEHLQAGDPTPGPRAILPFNSQGLFGGKGIRPNLFQLSGLDPEDYLHQDVQWQGADVTAGEDRSASFDIPRYLDLVWDSRYHEDTVTGESKQEYQKKLSMSMGLNASIDGFGFEMHDSFNETDFSETWNKYASVYRRQQVYTLRVNEQDPAKLQKYLTAHALDVFKTGTAKDIVDTFGTHL